MMDWCADWVVGRVEVKKAVQECRLSSAVFDAMQWMSNLQIKMRALGRERAARNTRQRSAPGF